VPGGAGGCRGGYPAAGRKCKVIKSAGIRDSKLLSAGKREKLSALIKERGLAWGIGVVDEKVIDKINIHQATLLAMKRAVEQLLSALNGVILRPSVPRSGIPLRGTSEAEESQSPKKRSFVGCTPQDDADKRVLIVVDGKFTIPNLNIEQEAVVDGDNKILSIAAASIIAKVYRDNLMRKFDKPYSAYGFAKHKGYATEYHRAQVIAHGLSPIHRLSFCKNLMPT